MSALDKLNIDPRIVFELAAQVDRPEVIAENYGLDPEFLAGMMEVAHFRKSVMAKRKELEESGYVLAVKAKLCFEDLLSDVYIKAKGEGVTLSATLEAAKFFRTVAGLDKQDVMTGATDKFSIVFNFNGGATQSVTVTPGPRPKDADVVDVESFSMIVPTTRDVSINNDLAYVQ